MYLPYKKALITGSTSGLGYALSVLLAKQKIPLILIGRNQNSLHQQQKDLSPYCDVHTYCYDLTKEQELKATLEVIDEQKPDLIINNAGFGIYGEATSTSLEEQAKLIDLNIKALTLISIKGAEVLKRNSIPGCIMQISSAASFFPYPSFASYSASKTYVNYFSKALAYELKNDNIAVLVACPGQFNSFFRKRASHGEFSQSSLGTMPTEKVAEAVLQQIYRRKKVEIIDFKYKLAVAATFLLRNTSFLMWVLKRGIDLRIKRK